MIFPLNCYLRYIANGNVITNGQFQDEWAKFMLVAKPFVFTSCYLASIELSQFVGNTLSRMLGLYDALIGGAFCEDAI